MSGLEGAATLVTGASRGIGAAVARGLASQGARVAMGSRSGDDLGIADAVARACDVRDQAQVQALVDAAVDRFGGLDIVVVNAGVGAYGPFLDLAPEHMEEIIDVNVKGALYTMRAALPHLLRSSRADAVMVASEA